MARHTEIERQRGSERLDSTDLLCCVSMSEKGLPALKNEPKSIPDNKRNIVRPRAKLSFVVDTLLNSLTKYNAGECICLILISKLAC